VSRWVEQASKGGLSRRVKGRRGILSAEVFYVQRYSKCRGILGAAPSCSTPTKPNICKCMIRSTSTTHDGRA